MTSKASRFRSRKQYKEWLAECPPERRLLAQRFPLGSSVRCHEKKLFIIGYHEHRSGELEVVVSEFDPFDDATLASATRSFLCPCCVNNLNPR